MTHQKPNWHGPGRALNYNLQCWYIWFVRRKWIICILERHATVWFFLRKEWIHMSYFSLGKIKSNCRRSLPLIISITELLFLSVYSFLGSSTGKVSFNFELKNLNRRVFHIQFLVGCRRQWLIGWDREFSN